VRRFTPVAKEATTAVKGSWKESDNKLYRKFEFEDLLHLLSSDESGHGKRKMDHHPL